MPLSIRLPANNKETEGGRSQNLILTFEILSKVSTDASFVLFHRPFATEIYFLLVSFIFSSLMFPFYYLHLLQKDLFVNNRNSRSYMSAPFPLPLYKFNKIPSERSFDFARGNIARSTVFTRHREIRCCSG